MQQLTTLIGYLAASQLLLTGLFYFSYSRHSRVGLLVAVLCLCLIAAVLPPFFAPEYFFLNYLDGRIAAATPALIWLFGHAVFVDDKKITATAWFFLISYQLARGVAVFFEPADGSHEVPLFSLLSLVGLIIALGLSLHVIVMAVQESNNDLLEERRRIRGPFAVGLGAIMALLVASVIAPEFLSDSAASQFGQVALLVSCLLIFLFFLLINLLTFRLAPDSQLIMADAKASDSTEPNPKLKLDDADLEIMRELDRKMLEERLFAEPELTIGQLASRLDVQEYKLRVIINRELGYKNFNQFLNSYRINEACQLLEKKSQHRNISIVAQNVGYASLSTFNQAFKKLKGTTPSEYKTQHASD